MKISRRGAAADHGWTDAKVKLTKVKWAEKEESLTLSSQTPIQGFAGPGRHIFNVSLSLAEVAELIGGLGNLYDDIGKEELADALESVTPALLRLTNIAARAF